MRYLLAAALLAASTCAAFVGSTTAQPAPQDKKAEKKKAQPKVDPKANAPDEATRKLIAEKTEQLRKAIAELKAKKPADDILADVEIYLKAATWIVRYEEWLQADSGKQTVRVLDAGLERAKAAADGKTPWRDVRGKPMIRGYRSAVDGSVQPYSVLYPDNFDPKKKYRLDIVLHGRDGTLTEVKFINGKENAKAGKAPDHFVMEVYGRGNNAYRWAGETDVFEAMNAFMGGPKQQQAQGRAVDGASVDHSRIVLRGFSMGGAGTWHIGLHHPGRFCVIGPGAGFTTTHGYIANLPPKLPEYQEKCLHIYDAIDYAENAFNVPVVAYSGEIDAQKKAADNIENALKGFKDPLRFTHLIAPGLAHQMPAEWQAKAETEYRKYANKGREPIPQRVRFVTYTPQYGQCDWLTVQALETTYQRAVIDAVRTGNTLTAATTNIKRVIFSNVFEKPTPITRIVVDGQAVDLKTQSFDVVLEKRNDKWVQATSEEVDARTAKRPEKCAGQCGPIDAAFGERFLVCGPTAEPWHPGSGQFVRAEQTQFVKLWDRYFRGDLPTTAPGADTPDDQFKRDSTANLILFGDPASNPLIAEVLPKLPITWTKTELIVNGVKYDPATHVPVLIYPNPLNNRGTYVVINSGHTFKEADLKGTNALLYPRLGDWAVIKPTPTKTDPAAYEVVAAGLFDENWQFPKK